jgi:hypothetical protein
MSSQPTTKRISKRWIAATLAIVLALAVLVVVSRREPVPQFQFLGNSVPFSKLAKDPTRPSASGYSYRIEAEFDVVAEAAQQELTAKGFSVEFNGRIAGTRIITFSKDNQRVDIEEDEDEPLIPPPSPVYVRVAESPSLWQRLIFRIRAALGL